MRSDLERPIAIIAFEDLEAPPVKQSAAPSPLWGRVGVGGDYAAGRRLGESAYRSTTTFVPTATRS